MKLKFPTNVTLYDCHVDKEYGFMYRRSFLFVWELGEGGGGCDWGRAVIVYVTLHIVEFNEGLLTASIYLRMAGMVRR